MIKIPELLTRKLTSSRPLNSTFYLENFKPHLKNNHIIFQAKCNNLLKMKTDTVVLSSNTEVVKTENSSFDNFTWGNWRKSRVVCKSIFRGKMLQLFDYHLETLTLLTKQSTINCLWRAMFRGTKINYIAPDKTTYKELFYKIIFEIMHEEI